MIDTYTMTETPDWYIYYDWHTLLMHTLWLTHMIDTKTMPDTPDWYIHYDWQNWFIHTISL